MLLTVMIHFWQQWLTNVRKHFKKISWQIWQDLYYNLCTAFSYLSYTIVSNHSFWHHRAPVRNLKPWVLMNSWDPQILIFVVSLLKILIKVGLISIFVHFFLSKVYHKRKSCQKVWVLAPTTLKSMGAEAPTAPILTRALVNMNHRVLILNFSNIALGKPRVLGEKLS